MVSLILRAGRVQDEMVIIITMEHHLKKTCGGKEKQAELCWVFATMPNS